MEKNLLNEGAHINHLIMKSYIFKILDIFVYQITYWHVEPPQFVEVSHSLIQ